MSIDKLKKDLEACETLKQVFNVCEQNYKIENAKLGVMSKGLVISGIIQAVKILRPEERKG